MSIHFKNVDEVLQILRDVYAYITIQNRNDELGKRITTRIGSILEDNTKQSGEANENTQRSKER